MQAQQPCVVVELRRAAGAVKVSVTLQLTARSTQQIQCSRASELLGSTYIYSSSRTTTPPSTPSDTPAAVHTFAGLAGLASHPAVRSWGCRAPLAHCAHPRPRPVRACAPDGPRQGTS